MIQLGDIFNIIYRQKSTIGAKIFHVFDKHVETPELHQPKQYKN